MSAAARGWGQAPVPHEHIDDVRLGAAKVAVPGGVHRLIVPLVVELARRFEEATGERLVPGHCWGYAARKVRGGTSWSNHAWGLAVDFNAPAHPLGAEGTFGDKAPAVSALAGDLGFRWGGDYLTRKDEMHFEFMGTAQDAAVRVAKLEGTDVARKEPQAQFAASWVKARDAGVFSEHTNADDPVTAEKLAVFLDRAGVLDKSTFGGVPAHTHRTGQPL